MAVVVDANRAGDFSYPLKGAAAEILQRLRKRSIRLASGGRLHTELCKTKFRTVLLEAQRAGLLRQIDNDTVNDEEMRVLGLDISSDDPHVVALLRVSNCRLLYTDDEALISDVRNKKFLNPRACVLKSTTPEKHLRKHLSRPQALE